MALYFEQLQKGDLIKPLVKTPGYQQVIKWAHAEGSTGPSHYDSSFARSRGLRDPTLQGRMLGSFLAQAVEEWAGYVGQIRRLSWRNQSPAHPNDTLTITGSVINTYTEGSQGLVECLLEMRSQRNEIVVSGICIIMLPQKLISNQI